MPDSMGRNSTWVDGKAPLISLMAVLSTTSIRAVWLLWLHAGAAYSAVEYARARVEVRRVLKFAPYLVLASLFSRFTRAAVLAATCWMCGLKVRLRSSVTPR